MNKKIGLVLIPTLLLCGCAINKLPSESSNVDASTSQTTQQSELDKWLAGADAKDYDEDGKIDNKDFEFYKGYKEWKSNPNTAKDYNGDHRIKEDDYKYYLGLNAWLENDDAIDYNEDTKINEDDYKIHLEYSKWLESDDAKDLNDDRKIDYIDYIIFKNPEQSDYQKWLASPNAKDYDKDGKISEKDYTIFTYFGSYKIRNYVYTGSNIYIDGTAINLKDIGDLLNGVSLTYSEAGVTATLTDEVKTKLGDKLDLVLSVISTLKINITSSIAFSITAKETMDSVPIEVVFYFNKVETGYKTSVKFDFQDLHANVSFEIYAI